MGARITDDVPVKELFKPTGYNCPDELLDKTWGDIKGGDVTLVELTADANGVYTPDAGKAFKKATVAVSASLAAWKNDTAIVYTKKSIPTTEDKALVPAATGLSEAVIAYVGEEAASITIGETLYTRYIDGDISVL